MELPKRAQRLEWNLNTINQLVTLLEICVGGVATWVEMKAVEARNEELFRSLESEVRKIENITYRVTIMEQSSGSTMAAIKNLQSLLVSSPAI